MTLHAPFPWFGGKRRVADVVWRAFGPDVPNYVEPFAGSLAVLLGRPRGAGKIETVNDLDCYVANFWRAVSADPDAVAEHADWPVNEADLHARHQWLVNRLEFRERMHSDPEYFDVQIAGWWVWGLCQWIGGGWCAEPRNRKHPKLDGIGKGVHSDAGSTTRGRPRPNLNGGQGIHAPKRQLPDLAIAARAEHGGRGIHSAQVLDNKRHNLAGMDKGCLRTFSPNRRPDMSSAGQGVHLPSIGNDRELNGVSAAPCAEWFGELQARLRRVRVACGDWTRVLGPSVLGKGKNVGGRRPCAVFLDPPYSHELRNAGIYNEDDSTISERVRAWALEHGDDPDLRIGLCGYVDEHDMPETWTAYRWKAARGYASANNDNRERETIWFSPHCLPIDEQPSLFRDLEVGVNP